MPLRGRESETEVLGEGKKGVEVIVCKVLGTKAQYVVDITERAVTSTIAVETTGAIESLVDNPLDMFKLSSEDPDHRPYESLRRQG